VRGGKVLTHGEEAVLERALGSSLSLEGGRHYSSWDCQLQREPAASTGQITKRYEATRVGRVGEKHLL